MLKKTPSKVEAGKKLSGAILAEPSAVSGSSSWTRINMDDERCILYGIAFIL
jgi:hypothetical protein